MKRKKLLKLLSNTAMVRVMDSDEVRYFHIDEWSCCNMKKSIKDNCLWLVGDSIYDGFYGWSFDDFTQGLHDGSIQLLSLIPTEK